MPDPVDHLSLGWLALLCVHVYLDHPGIVRDDAGRMLADRLDGLQRRGMREVILGSRLGPESRASLEEHRRNRHRVHGRRLPLKAAPVASMVAAADTLRARGELWMLLENAGRLVDGRWAPAGPGEWLGET